MKQRKIELTGNPEDFEKLERILASATRLVEDHLYGPYRAIIKAGYRDTEIACAFISLAYFILRTHRSAESAANTFDVLAQFDRQRHESIRASGIEPKSSRRH